MSPQLHYIITFSLLTALIAYFFRFHLASYPEDLTTTIMDSKGPVVTIVGSGLAGLAAINELINSGRPWKKIYLLEKTAKHGGNSIKASSGINGTPTRFQQQLGITRDSPDVFYNDTLSSGKGLSYPILARTLCDKSAEAINWLTDMNGINLAKVTELGGHSFPRTHRPDSKLTPGFSIISNLFAKVESAPGLEVIYNAELADIEVENNTVKAVTYRTVKECTDGTDSTDNTDSSPSEVKLSTDFLVVATGGFSGSPQMLQMFRPDLADFPTTNGPATSGDGQKILEKVGAAVVHMDKIQVHPTGFVDPKDPSAKYKILAAEALRGVGGVLINPVTGRRFVNELTTRDNVTNAILALPGLANRRVNIVLNEVDAAEIASHMKFYEFKQLMRRSTIKEAFKGPQSATLLKELTEYNKYISGEAEDPLGRPVFGSAFNLDREEETTVYIGEVTPVVHFTMGGVLIDERARVLKAEGEDYFRGIYAAGEVTGGVHGANRLGGSSLLECVVFGRIAAQEIVRESDALSRISAL